MWRAVWLLGLCLAGIVGVPSTAIAAADRPTSVTVSGPGLAEALTVRVAERPDLFKALLSEVDWLATRAGNAPTPDAARLGPKYQIVVSVDDVAEQTLDLYPLADGGPRVFRPAEQPKRKGAAAWFYGRVSMPETLREAGVPLTAEQPAGPSGGEGGGEVVSGRSGAGAGPAAASVAAKPGQQLSSTWAPQAKPDLDDVVRQWQRDMLLLAGGAVLLLLMLGFVSRLTHR